MNPRDWLKKLPKFDLGGLKQKKKLLMGLGAVAVFAIGGGVWVGVASKKAATTTAHHAEAEHGKTDAHGKTERAPAEHAKTDEHAKVDDHGQAKKHDAPLYQKVAGTLWQSIFSVQDKVAELRRADLENEKLRLENAHLRLKLESVQFDCKAQDAAHLNQELELRLDRDTGSKMGRTLASVSYKVPAHLMPQQLYTLAVSYFRAHEDEKAAVILTFLTGMEDETTYRTPKNYLMTGIAWYRVDNFGAAEEYFDRAVKHSETSENRELQGQARLWKALVAERTGKHGQSQQYLREVLNINPHSKEAAWVNPKEADRVVASHE